MKGFEVEIKGRLQELIGAPFLTRSVGGGLVVARGREVPLLLPLWESCELEKPNNINTSARRCQAGAKNRFSADTTASVRLNAVQDRGRAEVGSSISALRRMIESAIAGSGREERPVDDENQSESF